MTEDNGRWALWREKAWEDRLTEEEAAAIARVHDYPPSMLDKWLVVELCRAWGRIEILEKRTGNWTVTATQRGWLITAGGSVALGAAGVAKLVGLI